MSEWKFIGKDLPPEGEYIFATSGEDSPIFVTRLVENEWEIPGNLHRRMCFTKKEMFYTRADVVFWMNLPELPK